MSSSGTYTVTEARDVQKNALIVYPMLQDQDLKGDAFVWQRPQKAWHLVPDLPFAIGEGMVNPVRSIGSKPSSSDRWSVAYNALQFTEESLKPTKACYVVAVTEGHYWGHAAYFDASMWDRDPSSYQANRGFFLNARSDVFLRQQSFLSGTDLIVIAIKKHEKLPLFHWQLYKNGVLDYETRILHVATLDLCPVKFTDESRMLFYNMVCDALNHPERGGIFFHCAAGIGRSGSALLSALMLVHARFPDKFPVSLDRTQGSYPKHLLSWMHKNVRSGLLGQGQRGVHGLVPNVLQFSNSVYEGMLLSQEKYIPMDLIKAVAITSDEAQAILQQAQKEYGPRQTKLRSVADMLCRQKPILETHLANRDCQAAFSLIQQLTNNLLGSERISPDILQILTLGVRDVFVMLTEQGHVVDLSRGIIYSVWCSHSAVREAYDAYARFVYAAQTFERRAALLEEYLRVSPEAWTQ